MEIPNKKWLYFQRITILLLYLLPLLTKDEAILVFNHNEISIRQSESHQSLKYKNYIIKHGTIMEICCILLLLNSWKLALLSEYYKTY